jgi:sulfate transport system ATP-binding protein
MGFLGPVSRVGERLVRPHDLTLSPTPRDGAIEARVKRVVHLGFEVRIELVLADGTAARAQLTRAQTEDLDLAQGDVVWVQEDQPEPVNA